MRWVTLTVFAGVLCFASASRADDVGVAVRAPMELLLPAIPSMFVGAMCGLAIGESTDYDSAEPYVAGLLCEAITASTLVYGLGRAFDGEGTFPATLLGGLVGLVSSGLVFLVSYLLELPGDIAAFAMLVFPLVGPVLGFEISHAAQNDDAAPSAMPLFVLPL